MIAICTALIREIQIRGASPVAKVAKVAMKICSQLETGTAKP